jgi:UDP-3-O-[3-hydroxymyristoyl] glucosamine N-acyltransferase
MDLNLTNLASLVAGHLIGAGNLICRGANPPALAASDEITMLEDPARASIIDHSPAVAVVVSQAIDSINRPQIVVADPHAAFAAIVAHFRPPISAAGRSGQVDLDPQIDITAEVHPTAWIGAGTTIGRRTKIMPGAVIMPRCRIGDDCVVGPNVTLYEYTELADRVVIHAGAVLGANGFGYRQEDGRHIPTAQLGYVAIEADVEIGAGVTIDRGTYGATRIGAGTKIDNQVQIAHNCQIGKHNLLCSQVGIAGSTTTGDHVILAGQVGLKDHITVGDGAIVGAQAGVMEDLAGNQVYLGSPATAQREQMQIMAVQRRLPELRRELRKLQREIDSLQTSQPARERKVA